MDKDQKLNYKNEKYQKIYDESINPETYENFWYEQSKELFWYTPPKKDSIIKCEKKPFYKWFPNSTTNTCYNCIDRHLGKNNGENIAVIYESAYLKKSLQYTYKEIYEHVGKLAHLMKNKFNVKKGDRVIIYMPMVPEGIFAMLACARIGAIHSVVFGGFAAKELECRINDSNAVLIITASLGIEPRKNIPYLPIIRDALNGKKINILMFQREDVYVEKDLIPNITFDYYKELNNINKIEPCEELDSNDTLYILYTSGTTGSPKGIARDIGGTNVALNYCSKFIMDLEPGDVSFSTSDIGWVVGHSYIVYGPLIRGAASMIFEGKPIGTPDWCPLATD